MGEASLAFEALEEGGGFQMSVVFVREMLEEVAPALKEFETASYAEFGPELIV